VASPGLRRLAHLAERGNAILIFPQGRHLLPEMERAGAPEATFRHGAALLAEALGAPVVPFGLAGSEQLVPRDLDAFTGRVVAGIPLALRRGPLAIAFGPAMRPRPGEDVGAFTERLQAACFALARRAEASLG
jgi:1-acyl-sn-glycerol-3-phosphate acyltransferase